MIYRRLLYGVGLSIYADVIYTPWFSNCWFLIYLQLLPPVYIWIYINIYLYIYSHTIKKQWTPHHQRCRDDDKYLQCYITRKLYKLWRSLTQNVQSNSKAAEVETPIAPNTPSDMLCHEGKSRLDKPKIKTMKCKERERVCVGVMYIDIDDGDKKPVLDTCMFLFFCHFKQVEKVH